MAAMARTPVLPRATPAGALSAQPRRHSREGNVRFTSTPDGYGRRVCVNSGPFVDDLANRSGLSGSGDGRKTLLPELPHSQSHGLRIGLARRFGDDALVVHSHIGAAPQAQSDSRPDPKRVRHVVLIDPVDALFSAEIVIGARRKPQGVGDIAAQMLPRDAAAASV